MTDGAKFAFIHAAHRWPDAIHAALWPAALKNYTNLKNLLPTKYTPEIKVRGRIKQHAKYKDSPISKMAQVEVEPNLDHFHSFGSPVYGLEDSLQAQRSHNKWADQSRVGIFLCHSPNYASSVPLVLNTRTGNVSPQFHCIYNDAFDTCKRDVHFTSSWQRKAQNQNQQEVPLPAVPQFITQWDDEHTIGELTDDFNTTEDPKTIISPPRENQESEHASIQEPEIRRTRSGQHSRPNPRIFNDQMATANSAYLETFSPALDHEELQGHELLQADHSEEPHPFASIFALAGSADPDTLTFDKAMKAHDRAKFIKAMYKELGDHIGRKHWKVVPIRSIPTYSGKTAIPMVWAMKRKKNLLGEIVKWKARLCAGGH
ncbi:unnamed protein product [Cylindrotheca closterium]|uniref:Uncharacterized protein n=1 Tax=Cylindrotheca closterium TaxID=2856 RepID=A0AAD2PU87_9STRA|nr:unnamed protein product [Cylindrotheca closterium]